jgi:hypothetical protein
LGTTALVRKQTFTFQVTFIKHNLLFLQSSLLICAQFETARPQSNAHHV